MKKSKETEKNGIEPVVWMAAELPVSTAVTEPCSTSRMGYIHIPKGLDPGIGPYTASEIEQQLEEADRTLRDNSQWSTLNDILSDFRSEHAAWFK